MSSGLDAMLSAGMVELIKRLEAALHERGHGVMLLFYNLTGRDLDVHVGTSHSDWRETLRILRATVGRIESELSCGAARTFVAQRPGDLISSMQVVQSAGAHDRVRVWVRGGLAGELLVSPGAGVELAQSLQLEERAK